MDNRTELAHSIRWLNRNFTVKTNTTSHTMKTMKLILQAIIQHFQKVTSITPKYTEHHNNSSIIKGSISINNSRTAVLLQAIRLLMGLLQIFNLPGQTKNNPALYIMGHLLSSHLMVFQGLNITNSVMISHLALTLMISKSPDKKLIFRNK